MYIHLLYKHFNQNFFLKLFLASLRANSLTNNDMKCGPIYQVMIVKWPHRMSQAKLLSIKD